MQSLCRGDDALPIVRHAFEQNKVKETVAALRLVEEMGRSEAERIVFKHYEELLSCMSQLRHVQAGERSAIL